MMSEQDKETSNPHVYGAGTRLSEAYTAGRDGLPCPRHYAEPSSLTRQAYERGRAEFLASQSDESAAPTPE
jgi:hypothetical protein